MPLADELLVSLLQRELQTATITSIHDRSVSNGRGLSHTASQAFSKELRVGHVVIEMILARLGWVKEIWSRANNAPLATDTTRRLY
jgi:hypothetical protein